MWYVVGREVACLLSKQLGGVSLPGNAQPENYYLLLKPGRSQNLPVESLRPFIGTLEET